MYKRGKSWTYVADAGRDPATGRRRQRSKGGFRTRKAAEAAMRRVRARPGIGPAHRAHLRTVGEYLEQWLANQEPTARKTTFRGYKSDLDRVIRCVGHVRLHELTPMQLDTAYAEMMKSGSARGGPLSAKTVYNAHSSLRNALNDGVHLGVLIPTRRPPLGRRS